MTLADTDLDPANMPPCCVEAFSAFYVGAGEVVVAPGQEFICPTCGSYTILDPEGEWRFSAGDDAA